METTKRLFMISSQGGLVVQRSAAGFLTSPGTSVSPMAERTAPLVRGRWATKTLHPFSRSKSMKELPVPYWSRVVSHRGIDVLNRALEKYRLGQSEPIFCGR